MTVVAWDGKTLAVDQQGTNNGYKFKIEKLHLIPGGAATFTGEVDKGLVLLDWYVKGADPAKYPAFQATDAWSRLIVCLDTCDVLAFEQHPVSQDYSRLPFTAWGAGRDFAIGAMAQYADARRAVEIANEHSDSCGFGVSTWTRPA